MRSFLVAALALLGACSTTVPSLPPVNPPRAAALPSPPRALAALESDVEAMGDAAGAGQFAQARDVLRRARHVWARLRPQVLARDAAATTINAMNAGLGWFASDLDRRRARAAATDATFVTLRVADLMDLYTTPTPSDALRLDARLRQAQVAGWSSDWRAAATALEEADAIWRRLRPTMLARARRPVMAIETSRDLDDVFGQLFSALMREDQGDLQSATAHGLDLVDRVEDAFQAARAAR
jgi:hypothetical protein